MKVAVTGANGFVGQALCQYLDRQGITPLPLSRQAQDFGQFQSQALPPLGNISALSKTLQGCHALVHLAARTHQASASPYADLEKFRETNVALSQTFAEAAALAGVKRFIFISSIKVYGNGHTRASTQASPQAYSHNSKPAPEDAYGLTKLEAEEALKASCAKNGLELVIIRPPLIFSPHAKGNIAALVKAIRYKIPLPLASIHNQRDVLSLDNLCSLIALCLKHPSATNSEWLASDGAPLSTADMIRLLATAHKLNANLFPAPLKALELLAKITRKEDALQKLSGNLEVDSTLTQECLGWQPVRTMELIHRQ